MSQISLVTTWLMLVCVLAVLCRSILCCTECCVPFCSHAQYLWCKHAQYFLVCAACFSLRGIIVALHIIANKHLDDILCCELMRCTDWLTAARRAVYLRNLLHDSLCTVLHATVAYSIACGSIACCLCCCFCLVHLAPITDVRARAQSSRNARSSFRCGSIARNRGRRCDIGNM